MQTNKKVLWMWIVVIVINIGVAIAIISSAGFPQHALRGEVPIAIFGFIVFSVVPILAAKNNSKISLRLGHGIPIVLCLPALYGIYDMYTCTGKLCGLTGALLLIGFGALASIFTIFYTIGRFGYKQPGESVTWYTWVETLIIVGAYLGFWATTYFSAR